jgi:hypothetical protein
MRKLNKLAAAIAVALSTGIASHAQAIMTAQHDQEGDAMVFPVYYGVIENYYTIYNDSMNWVQGHIRFRSAAWTAELLDFDLVLSPGDVQVIRVADVDGDGNWEVDATVDPAGFQYVGLWPFESEGPACSSEAPEATGSNVTVNGCMDFSTSLLPVLMNNAELTAYPNVAALQNAYGQVGAGATQPRAVEARTVDPRTAYGYIEFIGEAVLVGCNDTLLPDSGEFCDTVGPNNLPGADGVSDFADGDAYYVNAWTWANPDGSGYDLEGVGNYLSGRYYITLSGVGGMSGNALMIRNFRTDANPHRVDNYLPDSEVIWHIDNPSAFDAEYVYRYPDGVPVVGELEEGVSFNNTWGPTLADGDDYNLQLGAAWDAGPTMNYTIRAVDTISNRYTFTATGLSEIQLNGAGGLAMDAFLNAGAQDAWDDEYSTGSGEINSIAEVELALDRNAQTFTSHFFQGGSNDRSTSPAATAMGSWYLAHYPTKFFRGENVLDAGAPADLTTYIKRAANYLLSPELSKVYNVEVWDTDEHSHCRTSIERAQTSPVQPSVRTADCQYPVNQELMLFSIADLVATQNNPAELTGMREGQVVLSPIHSDHTSADQTVDGVYYRSYPGILYTFNITNPINLDHLVPMTRSEWFIEPPM